MRIRTPEEWAAVATEMAAAVEADRAEAVAVIVAPYQRTIDLLVAALQAREWAGKLHEMERHCPLCHGYEREGHKDNCLVGRALQAAKQVQA